MRKLVGIIVVLALVFVFTTGIYAEVYEYSNDPEVGGLLQAYDYSDGIGAVAPGLPYGDGWVLQRAVDITDPQWVMYEIDDTSSITVAALNSDMDGVDSSLKFEVSSDGSSWTQAPLSIISTKNTILEGDAFGGVWFETIYEIEGVPAGTVYLKLILDDAVNGYWFSPLIDKLVVENTNASLSWEEVDNSGTETSPVTGDIGTISYGVIGLLAIGTALFIRKRKN